MWERHSSKETATSEPPQTTFGASNWMYCQVPRTFLRIQTRDLQVDFTRSWSQDLENDQEHRQLLWVFLSVSLSLMFFYLSFSLCEDGLSWPFPVRRQERRMLLILLVLLMVPLSLPVFISECSVEDRAQPSLCTDYSWISNYHLSVIYPQRRGRVTEWKLHIHLGGGRNVLCRLHEQHLSHALSPAPACVRSPHSPLCCLPALGLSEGLNLLHPCPSDSLSFGLFVFYLYLCKFFLLFLFCIFVFNYIKLLASILLDLLVFFFRSQLIIRMFKNIILIPFYFNVLNKTILEPGHVAQLARILSQ